MKSFKYTIQDEIGIHARPAGLLVKEAKQFTSAIMLSAEDKTADIKKLLALMSLGIRQGTEITVTVEGDDEEVAAKRIEEFLKENL